MFTLEIPKELCRDHWMIKKAVQNMTKLRTQSIEKGFKNLLSQDKHKPKQVSLKQPLLTSTQIFEKAEIKGVKNKKCEMLCELEFVFKKKKKTNIPHFIKPDILKHQNWANTWKLTFLK